ncbi:MAG TPA: hypothetical protein VGE21_13805 [Flavobacteriales bacterium]
MSKETKRTIGMLLAGVALLFAIVWIWFEHDKQKRRNKEGWSADADSLRKDWQNVGSSIQKGAESVASEAA